MINIVIPMAGAGSRFLDAGYGDPKPLVPIHGVPMIRLVIENLTPRELEHRFMFICQREHVEKYGLKQKFNEWTSNPILIEIDGLTEGAASTVLCAREYIDSDQHLMIANSDQYISFDIERYLTQMEIQKASGLIMTMYAEDKKWSFVEKNSDGVVLRVVEKEVISNEATVGIYNFSSGSAFVRAADAMIAKNLRSNGEFYVAPIYNELIGAGEKVVTLNIGSVNDGMYGLGTPEDLAYFSSLPISKTLVAV